MGMGEGEVDGRDWEERRKGKLWLGCENKNKNGVTEENPLLWW